MAGRTMVIMGRSASNLGGRAPVSPQAKRQTGRPPAGLRPHPAGTIVRSAGILPARCLWNGETTSGISLRRLRRLRRKMLKQAGDEAGKPVGPVLHEPGSRP